ncbi:MAG: hypothetical protein WCP79_06800 [Bacillota bacterium]
MLKVVVNWIVRHLFEAVAGMLFTSLVGLGCFYHVQVLDYIWYQGHGLAILSATLLSTIIMIVCVRYDLLGIERRKEQAKQSQKLENERIIQQKKTENELKLYRTKFVRKIRNDIEVLRQYHERPSGYATSYLKTKLNEVPFKYDSPEYQKYCSYIDMCLHDIQKGYPAFKAAALSLLSKLEGESS